MLKNDREVFDYLTKDDETDVQIDFLTYANFAFLKGQWIKQFETEHGGQAPTQAEIDNWISNLTEFQLISMRGDATELFLATAEELFQERLVAERNEIIRSTIVTEVKNAGSFRNQLTLALIVTILAPIILGLVLVAIITVDRLIYTPTSIANMLGMGHGQDEHAGASASPAK